MRRPSDTPYIIGLAAGILVMLAAGGFALNASRRARADIDAVDTIKAGMSDVTGDGIPLNDAIQKLESNRKAAMDAVPEISATSHAFDSLSPTYRKIQLDVLQDGMFASAGDVNTAYNTFYLIDLSYSGSVAFPGIKHIARFDDLMRDKTITEPGEWVRLRLYAVHQLIRDAADIGNEYRSLIPDNLLRKPVALKRVEQLHARELLSPDNPAGTGATPQLAVNESGAPPPRRRRGRGRRSRTMEPVSGNDDHDAGTESPAGKDRLIELPMRIVWEVEPGMEGPLIVRWTQRTGTAPRLALTIDSISMRITDRNRIRIDAIVCVAGRVTPDDMKTIIAAMPYASH